MRPLLLLSICLSTCSGCTMIALERVSLSQTESVTSARYREILDNFALLIADSCALPVYASLYAGGAGITDSGSINATTVWQHVAKMNGFGSQNANPALSRQTVVNWSVDPVVDPEKLEAIRACYRWVIDGPNKAGHDTVALLARPDQVPGAPGRHFGVLDQLSRLPRKWLGYGTRCDVPANACYKAHSGDVWVWVMPDAIKGLADFSLIIQDIARVNINSTTLFNPGFVPFALQIDAPDNRSYLDVAVADACPGVRVTHIGSSTLVGILQVGDIIQEVNRQHVADVAGFRNVMPPFEPRHAEIKLGIVRNGSPLVLEHVPVAQAQPAFVAVAVDQFGQLVPDVPYYRVRVDSQGSDPFLRSQIATITSH